MSLNWLNKLERKFGRYAVHNLTTYLIGTYIIGYAIRLFIPDMMIWLYLQPGAILHGQIWRDVYKRQPWISSSISPVKNHPSPVWFPMETISDAISASFRCV